MTAAAIIRAPRVDLPVHVEMTEAGLLVRWDGGEVTLNGDAGQQRMYIEALAFCYEAGSDEASNPRLFVP